MTIPRRLTFLTLLTLLLLTSSVVATDHEHDNDTEEAEAIITVDCNVATPLSNDIAADEEVVLPVACYRVESTIEVDGALTIQAGSVFRFARDTGLRARGEGKISAQGTRTNPIVLTSRSEYPHGWLGLVFQSDHPDNLLEHVIVTSAGQMNRGFNNNNPANVILRDGARARILHSRFGHSSGYGLYVDSENVMLDAFEGNEFANNPIAAMRLYSNQLGTLGEGNTFAEGSHVLVASSTTTSDQTWRALNAPYRMDGVHDVEEATVVIEAGAMFEFSSDSGLRAQSAGSIHAQGEADNLIHFRSSRGYPNSWLGITINTSEEEDASSRFEHVIIQHAGQSNRSFNNNIPANLALRQDSRVSVMNSVLEQSHGYGVFVESEDVQLQAFSNNTFSRNEQRPLRLYSNQLGALGEGNMFEEGSHVLVSSSTTSSDQTWRALNVPYLMEGAHHVEEATVTIDAGAVFDFMSDAGLRVQSGGALLALGSEDDPISFTGHTGYPLSWLGVVIASDNADNRLDYVTVSYAGVPNRSFNNSVPANLIMTEDGLARVSNSAFDGSGGYGIYLAGTVVDEEDEPLTDLDALRSVGNTFEGNEQGDLSFD